MDKKKPLNCRRCLSHCCRMAGYVEVTAADIRRLAKHLGLKVREFEETHIVKVTRRGKKWIKDADVTCQFLGEDRRCTVYEARPKDCREYVCWDQHDMTVYEFARFQQMSLAKLRKMESAENA